VTALEDLDVAIEEYHRAAGAFVRGNPAPLRMTFSHQDEVSLGSGCLETRPSSPRPNNVCASSGIDSSGVDRAPAQA
jgi:hypothetical protein